MKLILILAGIIFTGIIAILQYLEDDKSEKEKKANENALNKKINELNKNNSKLSDQLTAVQSDNTKLSQQLTKTSEQLTNTSLKLNENVLGGWEIEVQWLVLKENKFQFHLKNSSHLPLYNLRTTILNYDAFSKDQVLSEDRKEIMLSEHTSRIATIKIPEITLNPGIFAILDGAVYPIKPAMHFKLTITTRRKNIEIYIVYRTDNSTYSMCMKTFELFETHSVLLKEHNEFELTKEYWNLHFYHFKKILTSSL